MLISDIAIHGTGEANAKSVGKLMRKVGIKTSGADATAGEEALAEERRTYTHDGEKVEGFADAMVPTLEEKVVEDQGYPPQGTTDEEEKTPDLNAGQPNTTSQPETAHESKQARVEGGELYGAPADASKTETQDNEPPHARSGINDADEQEQAAPAARSTIRKSLASKQWTLLQPTPKIDPNGFEDPICDAFWKDMWVAAAVHNVSRETSIHHK